MSTLLKETSPRREVSTKGNIHSLNSEMDTYIIQGLQLGAAIGLLTGLLFYLALATNFISMPLLENMRLNHPVLFFILVVFACTFGGAGAGSVVGIGVPKIKPYPEQGWINHWKTLMVNFRGRKQRVYIPELEREAPHNRTVEEEAARHPEHFIENNKDLRL